MISDRSLAAIIGVAAKSEHTAGSSLLAGVLLSLRNISASVSLNKLLQPSIIDTTTKKLFFFIF